MALVNQAITYGRPTLRARVAHRDWIQAVIGWLVHNPYAVNVESDVLSLIILGSLGFIVFFATRRRRVRSFFGLTKTGRLLVYVSNLHLSSFESHGADGTRRSYSGGAVPEYETHLIAAIQQFFDSVTPSARQRSGPLSLLRWADIKVEIVPSPPSTDTLRSDGAMLAIGSPGYNAASQAIENEPRTLARFADDNMSILITNGQLTSHDPTHAFVQRTVDESGRTAFYLAGPSIRGTTGATHYLLEHWRELAKRYGRDRPFCIVLRVTSDDSKSSIELYRTP
jgi:hypothetical protein